MVKAEITFMFFAFAELSLAYLLAFTYKSKNPSASNSTDSYYKPYETSVSSLNLWQYASLLLYWGKMIFYGAALLTQLLAFMGYLYELNLAVWEIGVFIGVGSI